MDFLSIILDRGINFLKYPVAIVMALLTFELFIILIEIVEHIYVENHFYQYFLMGMGSYIVLWFFIFKRVVARLFLTIEHELTHTLFAFFTFHKIGDTSYNRKGEEFQLIEYQNNQMNTPLDLQKRVHQIAYFFHKKEDYRDVHILKSLNYKIIKNIMLVEGGVDDTIYSLELSKNYMKLFGKNKRKSIEELFRLSLNKKSGTLRDWNEINDFNPIFIKSGFTHKNINGKISIQSKWVAGVIQVKRKNYSFVIMIDKKEGFGENIEHFELTKPIFKEIIKVLSNRDINISKKSNSKII